MLWWSPDNQPPLGGWLLCIHAVLPPPSALCNSASSFHRFQPCNPPMVLSVQCQQGVGPEYQVWSEGEVTICGGITSCWLLSSSISQSHASTHSWSVLEFSAVLVRLHGTNDTEGTGVDVLGEVVLSIDRLKTDQRLLLATSGPKEGAPPKTFLWLLWLLADQSPSVVFVHGRYRFLCRPFEL